MPNHRPRARGGAAGRIHGGRILPGHRVRGGRRLDGYHGNLRRVALERLDAVRGVQGAQQVALAVVRRAAVVRDRGGQVVVRSGADGMGPVAVMPELVAAKVARWTELRLDVGVRPRVEQRDTRGRGAVILVREHDDGEVRVRSEEPLVLRRRRPPVRAERAQERRELTLEAAPGLAQRRDALEHVRGVAGVIADAGDVRDVRGAGIEVGGRARAARRVLEDPLLAPCRIAAGDRSVARAHVLRDHGQVQVGQTLRTLQPGHERRKIAQELVLRQLHRRRIVDEEQDVDVPVYGPGVCLGKNDTGPVGRRLALRSPARHPRHDGHRQNTPKQSHARIIYERDLPGSAVVGCTFDANGRHARDAQPKHQRQVLGSEKFGSHREHVDRRRLGWGARRTGRRPPRQRRRCISPEIPGHCPARANAAVGGTRRQGRVHRGAVRLLHVSGHAAVRLQPRLGRIVLELSGDARRCEQLADRLSDPLQSWGETIAADRQHQPVVAELGGELRGAHARVREARVAGGAGVRDLGPRARRGAARGIRGTGALPVHDVRRSPVPESTRRAAARDRP